MQITPLKTRVLAPPQDDLLSILHEALPPSLSEGVIVAISSKVVSIWQGRCVAVPDNEAEAATLKRKLIREESEYYLPPRGDELFPRTWTITEDTLIGSAGLDQSNGDGHFILWPEKPDETATELRAHIKSIRSVTNLGVLIVDSNSTPLRNGTVGTALGYAGLVPLRDYRNTKDLFGRDFETERLNVVETLASAATCVLGEGSESTPLALITDVPGVEFKELDTEDLFLRHKVSFADDIFAPLIKEKPWQHD